MMLITDDFALFALSLKLETEALEKSMDCEGRGLRPRPPVTPSQPPEQNIGRTYQKTSEQTLTITHSQPPKSCKCELYVVYMWSDLCEIQFASETSSTK